MTLQRLTPPLRLLFALLLFAQGGLNLWAQEGSKVRSIFLESPAYVFPALSRDNKQDLVELYEAQKKTPNLSRQTRNRLGGSSEIIEMCQEYLNLKLDKGTNVQIKLLPLINRTHLIAVIITSETMPKISLARFFSPEWKEIPSIDLLQKPSLNDFIQGSPAPSPLEISNALVERGILTYEGRMECSSNLLRVRLTTFDSPEAQKTHPKIVKALGAATLLYQWDGTRFKRL